MKKIKLIDLNKSLVKKVKTAIKYLPFNNVTAECGDVFRQEGVIVSASNPQYSMGGGLDILIKQKYPLECSKVIKGKNQRIGNVIFTITVDNNIKSSRELVSKALKFALKSTKKNETVLISGLGTGIGGLDEDDFVWLFLQAVIESSKDYWWGIKYTKKNGDSFRVSEVNGEPSKYEVGKWLEILDAPHNKQDCGHGLHLGKSFVGAGNYNLPEKIFFCIYKKEDMCGEGNDKVRVSKLIPLYECPRWLGYGVSGKKWLRKLESKVKFDPKKYNPYKATKLPTLNKMFTCFSPEVGDQVWNQVRNQVGDQVWNQVGDQVWNQVWDQVGDQVWDQVGDQVWNQVGDQVWNQVWDQVGDQVRDQVWNQVRDQVWDQVWATSYWAVNVEFSLGLSHWFYDFLKLGVMLIFVQGKIKVFGKKGVFLGEYSKEEVEEFLNK
jgi:O-acetyl-ADP-ribose deacetylase (regulator of RNase III)